MFDKYFFWMPYTPLSIRWDSLVHGMPKEAILHVNKELELNAWNLESVS